MRSRRSRTLTAVAALVAATALIAPAAASADAPTAAAVPTVTPAGSGAAAVVLPTGDRLVVGTGTRAGGISYPHAAGDSAGLATLTVGTDTYVVPAEAAPYLGHGLDLSLFDVTKLAASANGGVAGARTQVQLRFAAGVTPTAPGGVTLTSVTGQTAIGYLTPDSGHAFAQALRDAIKADVAAGRKPGTTALFGGLTSMAVLGTPTPVQPHYPLHILQVNALDETGAAANLPIILVNTDNARAFTAQVFASSGVARVAVPAGHYAAISFSASFDDQGMLVRQSIVDTEGITVPDTGTVPAAIVDQRTATSLVSFATPKPSTQTADTIGIMRGDSAGGSAGLTLATFGNIPTYLSPAAKPAVGNMALIVNWVGQSPASVADGYRYNLGVQSDHIDANQAYTPAASSLATLKHSVHLDPFYGTNQASLGSGFITPYGYSLLGMPVANNALTEYVSGGLTWASEMTLPMIFDPNNPVFAFAILDDDFRPIAAGQNIARTWGQSPMVAEFGQHPATQTNFVGCQACMSGSNLDVMLGMLGDSNRDTAGLDFSAAGTAQAYWNGQLVSSDTNRYGYLLQDVPAGPAKVRMVFDYDRTASQVTQAAKTHTDVTIPVPGKPDPSMTLPAGPACPAAAQPGDACQVLPALSLNYQFNALTDRNTSHSPRQNLVLHVGHLSYGGVGSRAHIDSVKVAVSFDQGATWQDVATHGGDGTYNAHWSNPAAGGHVELRVTATDCLGGSITQTVTDPYTVG